MGYPVIELVLLLSPTPKLSWLSTAVLAEHSRELMCRLRFYPRAIARRKTVGGTPSNVYSVETPNAQHSGQIERSEIGIFRVRLEYSLRC